jgi:hypothetical protein
MVVFPGFLGIPSVSGLEKRNPFWLHDWKVVDNVDKKTCGGCFPEIPNHLSVSGQKYAKFIVTSDHWGPKPKGRVLGVSYSGANIGAVLDLLAETATPLWPRQ